MELGSEAACIRPDFPLPRVPDGEIAFPGRRNSVYAPSSTSLVAVILAKICSVTGR